MIEDNERRIAELVADNKRLRRLLDQRDAPAELRHRLTSTLATLRVIIRKSAETNRELDAYVAHIDDRLDAVARAQAAADARGSIDLHSLVADELFHYGAKEGQRAVLAGPAVELEPRAGQVLALAIHELAVNAVEHGALGVSAGRITVSWRVIAEDGPSVTLVWKEHGLAGLHAGSHQGFGTEVLTGAIAYELKAATTLKVEPDGYRCTISFPLTEKIGRLAEA